MQQSWMLVKKGRVLGDIKKHCPGNSIPGQKQNCTMMNFQSLLLVEAIILDHALPINKVPYYFQATHCHIKPSVEGRICPGIHSKSPEVYCNWTGSSAHP